MSSASARSRPPMGRLNEMRHWLYTLSSAPPEPGTISSLTHSLSTSICVEVFPGKCCTLSRVSPAMLSST